MPFRLRHLQHNFELGQGEFVIGRSAECQLALDDPLVSRKHALLLVGADRVVIKDLGSRNGVIVNGTKIDTSRVLLDGDRIVIGSQEMTLGVRQPEPSLGPRRRAGAQTLSSVVPPHLAQSVEGHGELAKRADSFSLLATLADKALAMGRPDDAERILSSALRDILRASQSAPSESHERLEQAGYYGVRLAAGTAKGAWVDYVVALYTAARRPCPGPLIDELNVALRKTTAIDLGALRAYLELLRESAPGYGPAERFLLQRIEGLERLAALK